MVQYGEAGGKQLGKTLEELTLLEIYVAVPRDCISNLGMSIMRVRRQSLAEDIILVLLRLVEELVILVDMFVVRRLKVGVLSQEFIIERVL